MNEPTFAPEQRTPRYAWYVLAVMFLAFALSLIDRQVITILAPAIRRDLALSNADIGFLYGTAFAIFYALFGIPLGRLADNWHRTRLLTVGLALWSAMTAFSGFARSGFQLTAARIGVGVGEASASPAVYSLISDWFPKRRRATALAIYSSGAYLGTGFSLFAGGRFFEAWEKAWPHGGPLGLVGWQATYLAVGIPGVLLAFWVSTLREPVRGQSEGIVTPSHPAPFRALIDDLMTIIPPFTLIGAARSGIGALVRNLIALVVIAAIVAALIAAGEPPAQWLAVGTGVYAVFSWCSALRRRDLPSWTLMLGTPAFLAVVVAYGINSLLAYASTGMAPGLAQTFFHASPSQAGLMVGLPGIVSGLLGVTLGGMAADRLRRRFVWGRMALLIMGAVMPAIPLAIAFSTADKWVFYAMLPVAQVFAGGALGAAGAATQELVLPRMRGTATAGLLIGTTLIGMAMGPYLAGRIADLNGGDLRTGMLWLLCVVPVGLATALCALRWVPRAEATREARARAAGEPI